ncbi:F0F1 ATP synthase subunit B [Sphingorhabdus sp. IMCC26285]|uniref:ATP synthase subunit b n=2 Tax=Sphingorhabdus profundilacus TaxID=2509718 RepID=A0A6I4LZA8_9SPHN|nr:F0F1 ATP synthase subunit B [Sphingorhabdus profundilacus]MVZ97396.1 F0F1 ATP synthase subunit B [Sphingorhabdus profundilacus]
MAEAVKIPELTTEDHAAMGHGPVVATAASTEAQGGEEHAAPSALGFDATMLVALAMLVVIALALWKKVPAMIASALDKQISGIKEQLDHATALRTEAEAIKAEYEAKAKQAAIDAESMKAAAEDEAKLIVAQAKENATALIGRRAKAAEEKIAAAERAAIADVRAKAASAAAAAAAQLIATHHDAKADATLIDDSINALN